VNPSKTKNTNHRDTIYLLTESYTRYIQQQLLLLLPLLSPPLNPKNTELLINVKTMQLQQLHKAFIVA